MPNLAKHILVVVLVSIFAILMSASGLGLYLDRFVHDDNVTRLNQYPPPEDIVIVQKICYFFYVLIDDSNIFLKKLGHHFHNR